MPRWLLFFPLWLLMAVPVLAQSLQPVPSLQQRVTDLTGTLSDSERALLDQDLAAIERAKGAQIAILMVGTTQPETIEAYGIRVADTWKIGRHEVDDGAIILVAKDDRRMRIEVGYGLEGVIPDAIAKRIVAESMAPHFRQGDYAGGLRMAVAALGGILAGEPLPPPRSQSSESENSGGDGIVLIFLVVALAGVLRRFLGIVGSIIAAVAAGGVAWAIFTSWFAVFAAAIAAFFFSFMRTGGTVWPSGYSGSGSWGGSSGHGSDGGFSGGGGGFGGGGASGEW